jgi:DNA-directed RNA polymerase specialized sigma24 family protein
VDVFRGFRKAGWRFPDAQHLRRFLLIATRNRLIDRVRQHRRSLAREVLLRETGSWPQAVSSAAPRPSEVPQAADLWERIRAHCPPQHRPLLVLRREGYSVAEIADHTGLHADSVRRILRTLARRMAYTDLPVRTIDEGGPPR